MIKATIEDQDLVKHLSRIPEDGRQVFLLADGQIRLTGLSGTKMVNQMRANHRLGILESYVLGQAYIASALMASSVKGNDRIQLAVECGGKIGGIYTEAWACGAVRGYLKNNPIEINKPLESWDLNELFGPGFISVSRILEGSKTPFTGQTMMQYGDLAKDLALYYNESEQTPTMFSIGIQFDRHGRIIGAGGLFIQAMPGCSEEVLESLQNKSQVLPSIGKAVSEGINIKDYCNGNFSEYGIQDLGKENLGFSCPCCKENYAVFLSKMPDKEKNEIIKADNFPLVLECFNCGSKYSFTKEEIIEIFGEKK